MTLTVPYSVQSGAEWKWPEPEEDTAVSNNSEAKESVAASQDHVHSLLDVLPGLRRFAKSLTGSMAEADDLVQMAVERALRQPQALGGVANLGSWMRCVMRNGWLDNRKSAWHRYRVSEESSGDVIGEDGESIVAVRSQLRAVQAAMAALAPELREALVLVAVEGLSYRDAAERLGIPVACLNSRVARARATLAEEVGLLPAKNPKGR